jgi:hypothetical protein
MFFSSLTNKQEDKGEHLYANHFHLRLHRKKKIQYVLLVDEYSMVKVNEYTIKKILPLPLPGE